MTKNNRLSDRGLEHVIVETRRAVEEVARGLEAIDYKIDYLVEALRYYTPVVADEQLAAEDDGYD